MSEYIMIQVRVVEQQVDAQLSVVEMQLTKAEAQVPTAAPTSNTKKAANIILYTYHI